ncbi:hypothetical protein FHG89_28295 [Micromonospora orduensis]|uniref:Uncharacterized protein n=1 Tax=Micromonospora orduensis TaxID=1420891 RepID=A0A5C4QG55_9ACTN|nr:hypothetical protein [Micromonospora orduensis]TNH22816.1 hypothetical protein FHG89_28295 [Micromonospora orduensis]
MDAARTMRAQMFERVPFVRAAALSHDARSVAVADDSGVLVWDVQSNEPPIRLDLPAAGVRSLAFSPDGEHIVAGSADGQVAIVAASGRRVRRFAPLPGSCWAVGWDRSGRFVAAAGEDGTLVAWNADGGQELVRLTRDELSQGGRPSIVRALAFAHGGDRLVIATHAGAVVEWEPSVARVVRVLRVGEGGRPIGALAAADSGVVAAGDNRGVLHLWRGESAALELVGHVGTIAAVALDPSGRLVATGGDDRAIRVWDVESGRLLHILRGLNGKILHLAFSPDGSQLSACDGDAVVARWTVADGRLGHRVRCRPASVDIPLAQEERAWQLEAMRQDWETIRCGCPRGARHVPGSFADLVRAQSEDEVQARGLVNDVEIQGMLFEAAVPVTSMIIAALAEERLSIPARRALLDLLATFVDGESYYTEALEGRPALEEACREVARSGLGVLYREMEVAPAPGTASLVAEIIDSINSA